MLRAGTSALIILAALGIGCGNGSKCPAGQEPPPKAVYTCSPVPVDTPNTCVDPNMTKDPSLRFPVGCTVHLPYENQYYPCSGGQPCTCEKTPFSDKPDAGPVWICAT
jgi:hypothetical protein